MQLDSKFQSLRSSTGILWFACTFPVVLFYIVYHLLINKHRYYQPLDISIIISVFYLVSTVIYFSAIRNISALRKSKMEALAIIDNVVDGVLVINQQGNIETVNYATERMFGYLKKNLIGKNISILIPNDFKNTHNKYLSELNKDELTRIIGHEREVAALHSDGTLFPIEIGLNQIKFERQDFFIAIVRDISHKKRSEEQLLNHTERLQWARFEMEKALEEAESANKTKSLFLASVSHEIRTPLNGILGMTELLMHTELNEKQDRYAKQIYDSGELLLELINDILDLSKIEAGQMEIEKEKFNLKDTVESVFKLLQTRAETNNVELSLNYDDDVPSVLVGDIVRIKQILINIVGNAIKFTKNGFVKVRIKKLKNEEDFVNLRFEISDNGIGIDKNNIEKVFDKFTQSDSSITKKYGGTGLGLAICKQIVDLMEGSIGATSELGKGSTFWVELKFLK